MQARNCKSKKDVSPSSAGDGESRPVVSITVRVSANAYCGKAHLLLLLLLLLHQGLICLSSLSTSEIRGCTSLRAHAGYGGASTPSRHRWGRGKHLSLQTEISSTRNLVPLMHQKNQIQGDDCNQQFVALLPSPCFRFSGSAVSKPWPSLSTSLRRRFKEMSSESKDTIEFNSLLSSLLFCFRFSCSAVSKPWPSPLTSFRRCQKRCRDTIAP